MEYEPATPAYLRAVERRMRELSIPRADPTMARIGIFSGAACTVSSLIDRSWDNQFLLGVGVTLLLVSGGWLLQTWQTEGRRADARARLYADLWDAGYDLNGAGEAVRKRDPGTSAP